MTRLRDIVLLLVALFLAGQVHGGDNRCKGYEAPGNPFFCFAHGNCTWWAAYKRSDLRSVIHGDAKDWYENARRLGFPVGPDPSVGAVAVFSPTASNKFGHVAYVETVLPDGSFDASEMDYYGSFGDGKQEARYQQIPGGYKRGTGASLWKLTGFIYPHCDPNKWRCDMKINGPIGWFPPVKDCQQASQWFRLVRDEKNKVSRIEPTEKSSCPQVCYAN